MWAADILILCADSSFAYQSQQVLVELLGPNGPLRGGEGSEEEGVTTLVATSRLQTAIAADSVIVLGAAESRDDHQFFEPVVVEQGTPAELLCEDGEFSRLVHESGEEQQLMDAVAELAMAGDDLEEEL